MFLYHFRNFYLYLANSFNALKNSLRSHFLIPKFPFSFLLPFIISTLSLDRLIFRFLPPDTSFLTRLSLFLSLAQLLFSTSPFFLTYIPLCITFKASLLWYQLVFFSTEHIYLSICSPPYFIFFPFLAILRYPSYPLSAYFFNT